MSRAHKQQGFTLVEMLVVAPIVILAIGAFLTVIISMTGEVLASRASNTLSYTVQDALNRIEQDVKQSSSFLATNNVSLTAANAQGYNDDDTNFTNVGGGNDTGIILNMVATTGNPISSTSGYVYLKNKPNACASAQGNNTPFTYNVVYFIKDSTLWRRTIMPTSYTDTTNTVCALPFQQPSCSPAYMDSKVAVATYCKTNDIKLVEGVTASDFVVQYFSGESTGTVNSTASDPSASTPDRNTALQSVTTTRVSITAKQTAAGRDVERAASLRASRLDINASSIAVVTTDGVPAAPNVSSKISGITDVAFTWQKVPGATSYTMQYQRNGGAWTAGTTNSAALGFTVAGNGHKDVINARVTAQNGAGVSGYGTNAFTVPLWSPMNFEAGWSNYSQPYANAAFTKTSAGVIFLKGLVRSGSGVIAYLPAGYRPAKQIMFENSTVDAGGRLDVYANGAVVMNTGNSGWFSLDGVAFMPSGTTYTAPTFQNGWLDYSPSSGDNNWQAAGYMTDSLGRVQMTGLVRAGPITSTIFNIPAALRPSEYMHVLNDVGSAVAHFGVAANGDVGSKGYGNNFHSLQYMYYPTGRATGTTCTTQWCALPLANGWAAYGNGYGVPQYTKSADGIVILKGLLNAAPSPQNVIATLPAGYCPAERLLMATASNAAWARLDIIRLSNGTCQLAPQAGSSTTWFTVDDIRYIAEP